MSARSTSLVEIAARRGQAAAAGAALRAVLGAMPPLPGHATVGASATLLWIAPDTWLAVAPPEPPGALAARLAAALGPAAAVIDQSCGLAVLRLDGPRAREVLARGCRIDLHPRAFGPGRVARTIVAQIPTILHQLDDAPSFELLVPSTLARSFGEFLEAAA